MKTTVEDNFGDDVSVHTALGSIFLNVEDSTRGGNRAEADLTPEMSRKIRKALKRAEKEITE